MIQVRRGHTGQALVSLTGVPVEEDKVALCKPRREASGETSPGFPVISEVQALELREEISVCEPPSLWHFVMAALDSPFPAATQLGF